MVRAYLIAFSALKTGHAERVIETKTLINLRIDPEFRPPPEPCTEKECRIDGLLVARRRETVGAVVAFNACQDRVPISKKLEAMHALRIAPLRIRGRRPFEREVS
jgi:hypothetical protein